ncbi:DUF2254 domain-containing protein [Sphingomonas albertensis]|uniref:DUF2254 domain-containing protein n=1 Tax=Sphingomonas albertensis TaxID=2762591 RepID=A0ABR7AMP6_9SPHN|nr:DUF2254 domain-containing protein [Sphingomonas albertensis]MBC3941734.1 DUF2254 domain-containing protein [Sphingomonas albertensis]
MKKWSWILRRIVRKIWFRAAVISLLSVVLAILSGAIVPYLPYSFGADLGQDAVGTILQIMASSMLAVTTFSLTAMVSAYSSATQLATPRATQLLINDPTSQSALSTFLGAFVFSIVGIIGLQTHAYGSEGRIILFGATVLIVVWVVVTLLRWIAHITAFGRMSDVIDRVENAAADAMTDFAATPYLGGRPAIAVPAGAQSIRGETTGYVTHVDVAALGAIATQRGIVIHVVVLPGAMVHPHRDLMRIEGTVDDALRTLMLRAFTIERHRSFDQDPRLGLIALSEIASRALSPATNDPGTAIEVLNALLRVLLNLPVDQPDAVQIDDLPPVYLTRPTVEEMLTDAFRPILREGSQEAEVTIRLTITLAALHAALPAARRDIRALADHCLERARRMMDDADDLAAFEAAHRGHWGDRAD